MNAEEQDLAVEIRLMRSQSRQQTLRQMLRTAALFASGGAAGLAGLVFLQSEFGAVGCAIAATALVSKLQNKGKN